MRIQAVHTVPVWENAGQRRIAQIDECRPDLEPYVIGWCNLAVIELIPGEVRTFLLVYRSEDVT
jgi:hypothetical protein